MQLMSAVLLVECFFVPCSFFYTLRGESKGEWLTVMLPIAVLHGRKCPCSLANHLSFHKLLAHTMPSGIVEKRTEWKWMDFTEFCRYIEIRKGFNITSSGCQRNRLFHMFCEWCHYKPGHSRLEPPKSIQAVIPVGKILVEHHASHTVWVIGHLCVSNWCWLKNMRTTTWSFVMLSWHGLRIALTSRRFVSRDVGPLCFSCSLMLRLHGQNPF